MADSCAVFLPPACAAINSLARILGCYAFIYTTDMYLKFLQMFSSSYNGGSWPKMGFWGSLSPHLK